MLYNEHIKYFTDLCARRWSLGKALTKEVRVKIRMDFKPPSPLLLRMRQRLTRKNIYNSALWYK